MRTRFCVVFGVAVLSVWPAFLLIQAGADSAPGASQDESSGEGEPSFSARWSRPSLPTGDEAGIPLRPWDESGETRSSPENLESAASQPMEAWAERLFRRLDRNGDGMLNVDEMPTALRATRDQWGAD